jgi:hypothetical protein
MWRIARWWQLFGGAAHCMTHKCRMRIDAIPTYATFTVTHDALCPSDHSYDEVRFL